MKIRIPNFVQKKGLRFFIALCAGTASLSTLSPVAFAQEEQIEEVLVTGLRIARDSATSAASPISVIGGDGIRTAGQAGLGELLRESPALITRCRQIFRQLMMREQLILTSV
jgi:hypothetical protein